MLRVTLAAAVLLGFGHSITLVGQEPEGASIVPLRFASAELYGSAKRSHKKARNLNDNHSPA
jgi:hypothetical protein